MSHDDLKLRRNEEHYFLEQNQLLIKKLHDEQRAAADAAEHASHRGKCHQCGETMQTLDVAGHQIAACQTCAITSLPVEVLTHLLSHAKGRRELHEVEVFLQANTKARRSA